jgi:hypothetical protein
MDIVGRKLENYVVKFIPFTIPYIKAEVLASVLKLAEGIYFEFLLINYNLF